MSSSDAGTAAAQPHLSRRGGAAWQHGARQARVLSWLSLIWMTGEGALGLVAGATAGSIALIGWALGSVIEGLAAVIVIWRFTGSHTLSDTAEGRAQKAVAVSFFLLAPYIAVEAIRDLLTGHHVGSSVLGILVTAASLLVMPALGIAKQRLGARLDSGATAGEGVQNLLCAAQAGAVLLGRGLTVALGWWWIDPISGLVLAAIAIHEGRRGQGAQPHAAALGADRRGGAAGINVLGGVGGLGVRLSSIPVWSWRWCVPVRAGPG